MLVITKSLGRGQNREDYQQKQVHVELQERMRIRNPGTQPSNGDRVPYVMIKSLKKSQNYDKGEDPLYVLENNLTIDQDWYIERQLQGPLLRIFGPIMND